MILFGSLVTSLGLVCILNSRQGANSPIRLSSSLSRRYSQLALRPSNRAGMNLSSAGSVVAAWQWIELQSLKRIPQRLDKVNLSQ